jgi:hypothetical protein
MMRKPRLGLAVLVGVVLSLGVGAVLLIDVVPVASRLPNLTSGLRARILRYSQETGHPPQSLATLAIVDPPSRQFVTDPWGQDFQYAVSQDGVVTRTSLSGRATIEEAAKDDAIRVWRFRIKSDKPVGDDLATGASEEGWIGNDRWGKPKTATSQSK